MGLSNEERTKGLYYAIDNIVEITASVKNEDSLSKLLRLTDQLWHAFLGKTHNSSHWILGSSAVNEVAWDTTTPWGEGAINHHCSKVLAEESDELKREDVFDAFERFLDISGLLGQVGQEYKAVYEIYSWSEQLIYYLRRYDDDFLKNLEPLSRLVSDIQGECFNLFRKNDVYAKAYILSTICKMIYGDHYPHYKEKMDSLTLYLSEEAIHHDLSRPMMEEPLKFLADLHVELYRAKRDKKLTLALRAKTVLKISGRRYEHDHQFKKLMKMLKPRKKVAKELELLFSECKKAHEEREKRERKSFQNDNLGPMSIYGLSFGLDERKKKNER